jgi:murein DD-endopeptidase MepM/ murein hydrolase activator NlpD
MIRAQDSADDSRRGAATRRPAAVPATWRGLVAIAALAALALTGCNKSGRPPEGSAPPPQPTVAAPAASAVPATAAGSYVVVAGDTVHGVANRFGVPIRSLIELNALQPPFTLKPGATLQIPDQRVHIVAPGDTIYSISRQYGVDSSTLVRLNSIPEPYTVLVGQTLVLPAPIEPVSVAAAAPAATAATAPATVTSEPLPDPNAAAATIPDVEPSASGGAEPAPTVAVPTPTGSTQGLEPPPVVLPGSAADAGSGTATPPPPKPGSEATPAVTADAGTADPAVPAATPSVPVETAPDANAGAPAAEPAGSETAAVDPMLIEPAARSSGTFLWPVTGKVVSEFGPKEDGLHNDGINIAAPLGTPVRAAENGVVVYAGNELRGFGNMLLIRHADGFVSAYAHNESLLVKRGDTVTRGQTIARVGASGNVTSPQLHFELRRGTEAVDPREYLGSSGA